MSFPLLSAENVSKRFNALNALESISFQVQAGEVLGLAGRSGAGKSVLLQILAGFVPLDSGQLSWQGEPLPQNFRGANDGIAYISSEPMLVEQIDITGNIFLGHELSFPLLGNLIRIPRQQLMAQKAMEFLRRIDWPLPNLNTPVLALTSEQRQLVAIARTMATQPKLVLVDDPTQLLGLPLQKKLLELIQNWQREGVAVIFSSSELDLLFAVTEKILVLNEGRMSGLFRTDETSREEVVSALAGRGNQREFSTTLWALDRYYQARQQAEMLQHQQQLLQRDLANQDDLNRQLLNQLSAQVLPLDSANLALQSAQRRLLTERELERKRLSRELHDQLIQDLLSLNYQLEAVEEQTDSEKISAEIDEIHQDVRQMIDALRRICGNLRPPTIDSLGLAVALQSYCQEWGKYSGIEITVDIAEAWGRLPEDMELAIFRIVQEALSNIRKHAHASAAKVSITPLSARLLCLSITDNGQGIAGALDVEQIGREGHYGLLGISERVALLGGRLKIGNRPEGGLFLEIELPHPRVRPSAD